MDDLYAFGPDQSLRGLSDSLKLRMNIMTEILAVSSQYEHLKRARLLSDKSIFIIPSAKHIDAILKILNLENANGSPTPMVKAHSTAVDDSALLAGEKITTYRSCGGTALCLNNDRGDAAFSVRELTTDMKAPTTFSMQKLVRHARYLKQTRDYGTWIQANGQSEELTMFTDTNWGLCKKTRKSVACGVLMLGANLLVCYSRGQQPSAAAKHNLQGRLQVWQKVSSSSGSWTSLGTRRT